MTLFKKMAMTTAGALLLWQGSACAGSSPLTIGEPKHSAESTQAMVSSALAYKQVAAIYPNPANANLTLYWMTDGSYSEWDNHQQKFTFYSSAAPLWFAYRGWPAGKQVAAIHPDPVDPNLIVYWWTDGSFSEWNIAKGEFRTPAETNAAWFTNRGLPAGKQVTAVYPNPANANLTLYWMTDGSYSEWNNNQQKFTFHSLIAPKWFADRGWPAGKRVAAIYPNPANPNATLYWMTDGTYSHWDNNQQKFIYHSPIAPAWFTQRGWPAVAFDPLKYEVRDIRINEHSPNGGAIYANGRMQYKVVVRVQIQDSDGNGVYLGGRGTGTNKAREARDLVTLYLGDKRVDTPYANLKIDGEWDPYSSTVWHASRTDAGYDKTLSAYHLDPEVMYEAHVDDEHDSDEMEYAASDGWNTYTYWVSTTQQTGPDPMRICARAGTYGQNGEGYYDSCANGRNESARVRSQAPKHYGASDYNVSRRSLGSFDMGGNANHVAITVNLKGATLRTAENIGGVVDGNNGDVRCIAAFNHHWGTAVGQHWNSNTSLYFVTFGWESVSGPYMYAPWHNNYPRVPVSGLDKKSINLIETTGSLYAVVAGRNTGTWTNCRDWSWSNKADYKISGRVKFMDSFGNEGVMTWSPLEWSYVVQ
ncbi:hypothetical protein ACEUAM_22455 [Aeromonas hydrophila]|uniref:hypothetical protein n=1 Tax=Aeromonas hydrophila TaxID=644 RepID=UPI0038CFEFEB